LILRWIRGEVKREGRHEAIIDRVLSPAPGRQLEILLPSAEQERVT
jgi:hypothetical protein